jgi:hypothetical protein
MGFMKYAVEICSGSMMYIPSFIKIGSAIQKLIQRQHKPNVLILKNESILLYSVIKSFGSGLKPPNLMTKGAEQWRDHDWQGNTTGTQRENLLWYHFVTTNLI